MSWGGAGGGNIFYTRFLPFILISIETRFYLSRLERNAKNVSGSHISAATAKGNLTRFF